MIWQNCRFKPSPPASVEKRKEPSSPTIAAAGKDADLDGDHHAAAGDIDTDEELGSDQEDNDDMIHDGEGGQDAQTPDTPSPRDS